MKITAFCLVVVVAGAVFAAGQEAPGAQTPSPRAFKLDLQPLYLPGYKPAREVRLALWDSPMSRLEVAVSREQWALRNPGPAGNVVPFQEVPLPFRFRADAAGQSLVLGPGTQGGTSSPGRRNSLPARRPVSLRWRWSKWCAICTDGQEPRPAAPWSGFAGRGLGGGGAPSVVRDVGLRPDDRPFERVVAVGVHDYLPRGPEDCCGRRW